MPTLPRRRRPGRLAVTTALLSVQPYPSWISHPGTRRSNSCSTSSGSGAAPLPSRRSELRSASSRRSASSIWIIAGTSAERCTRCSSHRPIQSDGLNQRCTMARPGSSAYSPAMLTMRPYACDSGSGVSVRVTPGTCAASHRPRPAPASWWCVNATPLARPVVPPVYRSAARSSSLRGTMPLAAPASRSLNEVTVTPAPAAVMPKPASPSPPATRMWRSSGARSVTRITVPSSSAVVTTVVAPESLRMCASSSPETRNTTGVITAPARQSAPYAISTSGQLAMSTTTRSPGRTPSAAKPAAVRPARSRSSADRHVLPSNTSASWSPRRAKASSAS